jgi:hypothetical protein
MAHRRHRWHDSDSLKIYRFTDDSDMVMWWTAQPQLLVRTGTCRCRECIFESTTHKKP